MPRLPIVSRCGYLTLMLLAVTLAAPVLAAEPTTSQPSVETLMYHLTNSATVVKARKLYQSSVDAAMLYSQCPAEYQVDANKRASMDRMLYADELALRNAFTTSHQKWMYKLPSDKVLAAIDHYVVKLRNDEAVKLGALIDRAKSRCNQSFLKRLDKAYEQRRQIETQAAAQAAADEEKRRQEVPVMVQPEQQNKQSH